MNLGLVSGFSPGADRLASKSVFIPLTSLYFDAVSAAWRRQNISMALVPPDGASGAYITACACGGNGGVSDGVSNSGLNGGGGASCYRIPMHMRGQSTLSVSMAYTGSLFIGGLNGGPIANNALAQDVIQLSSGGNASANVSGGAGGGASVYVNSQVVASLTGPSSGDGVVVECLGGLLATGSPGSAAGTGVNAPWGRIVPTLVVGLPMGGVSLFGTSDSVALVNASFIAGSGSGGLGLSAPATAFTAAAHQVVGTPGFAYVEWF